MNEKLNEMSDYMKKWNIAMEANYLKGYIKSFGEVGGVDKWKMNQSNKDDLLKAIERIVELAK